MIEVYREFVEGLRASSLSAYFQTPNQLVNSRQRGAVPPLSGNSIWVSHREGSWYLCTGAPHYDRITSGSDLVRLCVDFADHGRSAQPRIPPSLIELYRLIMLSDAEAEAFLDNSNDTF